MKIHHVGDAKVYLIAGGGKCYTSIAAKFCRSNRSVDEIIGSEYSKKLVEHIVESGHLAATEFDTYIFGIENVSRVFEAQLIRKRLASYMISSGRENHKEIKNEIVLPKESDLLSTVRSSGQYELNINEIIDVLDSWYKNAVAAGVSPNDARYILPQGSTKKVIFAANAHGLLDWFKIRCCFRAADEIRDVAWKILKICKETNPDLFKDAGPSCASLGLCPEMEQCEQRKGKIMQLKEFKEINKKISIEQLRNLAK